MSDSEPDFDDPRFLVDLPSTTSTSELTYAEKRRRTVGRGREKAQQSQSQGSRKQREEQQREEGLRRNLIAANTLGEATEGESKALKMMRQMGFQPGQGLGRKRSHSPPPAPSTSTSAEPPSSTATATAGLGSRTRPPSPLVEQPQAQKPRTEPLKFELREKRTGLGVPSTKKKPYLPPPSSTTANPASQEAYLTSLKSTIDARRAFGLFKSLRRTGEELDLRAGVEGNVMWRDEEAEAREEERKIKRRRLEGLGDDDEEVGESRRGRGRGGLAYEEGLSSTVVDASDEEDEAAKEEEDEWFASDIPTRLALAQAYLRETYCYCQWCGVQYEGKEDLEGNCPGMEEEMH
ncbi:hypothetical protein BCR35DRAFT_352273 [Leucosporidium creatinivorum]|uniref:G-patch domain-containing protein n=1 Tax=Leucosporidium creatinivorum TaxID=106004 RepID=A0A1Y2FEC3_9BASI|nr:hypothetical protein BCR35DRAFT_352273 [Leucosporidium creatinivorum]